MNFPKYKHLFFDLDHTLYDFEQSSLNTLVYIFDKYHLNAFWSFDDFHSYYKTLNKKLWKDLSEGKTTKEELKVNRFLITLRERQPCTVTQAKEMSDLYMDYASQQPTLIDGALEVVEILSAKYSLHIITNGFVEVQYRKMDCTGLTPFFKHIFISEKVGASKPSPRFFQHAIRSCNAKKEESIVIGDNLEADILGANNFKLDSIWFNPERTTNNQKAKETYEIQHLKELLHIL